MLNRMGSRMLAAIALVTTAATATAEERVIDAYAPLEGRGQIYPTGTDRATFVGAFSGVLFVEGEGDLVAGGGIMCPAMIEMKVSDGTQTGQGRCAISNEMGERIYAEWTCAGASFVGCDGTFKLVSGTGEYSGIAGEGEFRVRSGLEKFAASTSGNIVRRATSGLAVWRDFRFVIPE